MSLLTSGPIPGLLTIAALTAGCGAGPPADAADEAVRQEVLERIQAYYLDFSARDWRSFADHFWPGATMTTVWQTPGEDGPRVLVTTIPEFIIQAPLGPGSKPVFAERMLGADIRVSGNLAQVWSRYEAEFGDSTELLEWRGIDAFTLLRHEAQWKITSISFIETGDDP